MKETDSRGYLSQFKVEGLSVVSLAEGPEEPVVGGADSDSGLQQKTNRLLHLGDDQVHRRRHVHEFICKQKTIHS